jgi:hypothetical protein
MRPIAAALVLVAAMLVRTSAAEPPATGALFEDDAEAFLKLLTNPTGDSGEGHPEKSEVFSGTTSIKIVPLQRFSPSIEGWKYRIAEKPNPGEYRFLRYAWKANGCDGVMLQLHDEKDWNIRYTSGQNVQGWGCKFIAPKPPAEWTVVTIDLYADFGEREIHGIALTAFNGTAAYFDHIYLGRTIEDLDRINATGLRKAGKPLELTPQQLNDCWTDLGGDRAEKAYRAYWTLVSAPTKAEPFLKAKLAGSGAAVDGKQLRQWVLELDHERFAVREAATKGLAKHLDAATPLLKKELERTPSPEARTRIDRLLAKQAQDPDKVRAEKARRVLAEIVRLRLGDTR